jgi:hypothetical protein
MASMIDAYVRACASSLSALSYISHHGFAMRVGGYEGWPRLCSTIWVSEKEDVCTLCAVPNVSVIELFALVDMSFANMFPN